jgi:uncharacterized membrane protein YfcA
MGGVLAAIAVGFGSGVLSGVFGIGGGLVTTPAIRLLLGYGALIAVGTPLPVILPGALTGALSYWRRGEADVRAGLLMGLVGGVTSALGAFLSNKVGGTAVMIVTAGVILIAAADMILQERRARRSGTAARAASAVVGEAESDEALDVEAGRPPHGRPSLVRLAAVGLVAGIYSGFLGLGGGFVVVPGLTRFCGFSVKRAIGTSLITVAALAIPGSIAHSLFGHIDWMLALMLAIGVVPGAALGARLTRSASERTIRLAFAALLTVVAVWLAVSELAGLAG